MRYLIVLMILLMTLQAEIASDIYTNELKPVKITVNSIQYVAFNLKNARVLQARLSMFNDVFFPVTNSIISNQFRLLNEVHSINLNLEIDNEKLRKRIVKSAGIFGGLGVIGGFVLGILIFK